MNLVATWKALGRNGTVRMALAVLGVALIMVTPLVAVLPGPGGLFTFAAGLSLVLRNSRGARRRYVRFKRRWPRSGGWCDWGLRRPSARRRAATARERMAGMD